MSITNSLQITVTDWNIFVCVPSSKGNGFKKNPVRSTQMLNELRMTLGCKIEAEESQLKITCGYTGSMTQMDLKEKFLRPISVFFDMPYSMKTSLDIVKCMENKNGF